MKILVISECYPRVDKTFSGIYLGQLFRAFSDNGNSVDVLIPIRGSQASIKHIQNEGFDYYEVGYTTNKLEIPLNKSNKQLISGLYKLARLKYDLISIHITSDTVINLVSLFAKNKHIPVVMHYHGLNVWREYEEKHPLYSKYIEYRRSIIMKRMDAIFGVSDKVCDIIRIHGFEDKVFTVYNGVNTHLFNVKIKERGNEIIRFITVARLIKTKGVDYLVSAFQSIHRSYPNTELIIVGDGPEEQNLRDLVSTMGLSDCVVFRGRIPNETVAECLTNTDLFVLPSYYEALGCVYLEAMACGLPAIGVKGMGIDEIIVDGVNGYIVEPKNKDDLVNKMKSYIDADPNIKQDMSRNARNTSEKYTWHNIAIQLEEKYKSYLNE